jgi:hypothetical protein
MNIYRYIERHELKDKLRSKERGYHIYLQNIGLLNVLNRKEGLRI